MAINRRLLPIKAHFFFFMAAMGPILPQLSVYGKQLGISTVVMGSITGVLPILFLLAKPMFGFIVDYFTKLRKTIFMSLLFVIGASYTLCYFLPMPMKHDISDGTYNFSQLFNNVATCNLSAINITSQCTTHRKIKCLEINQSLNASNNGFLYLKNGELEFCFDENEMNSSCVTNPCSYICTVDKSEEVDCLYGTITFWGFVLLMSIGTIGFNVANSISDAVCFDVLGENNQMDYGKQRVWGTIGFGIAAFISGYIVDWISDGEIKSYTPVFVAVLVFTAMDLISCIQLKLPPLPKSENIFKDVRKLLRHTHITIFVIFATLLGVVDSFLIYFLFWYLEDLAIATGAVHDIKLLEGLTVAAETLVGEVIFFSLSGKILAKIGYGHSLTLCFLSYSLRLVLVSFIPSPWWILPIEVFMQGPSYAMGYTTIVAYASAVSPPGTSATMQGIVAGMDDGFGYAIGSLLGGILYSYLDGKTALRIFSLIAVCCAIVHFILYKLFLRKSIPQIVKRDSEYKSPHEALTSIADGSEKN